jgi:hypothetical protein
VAFLHVGQSIHSGKAVRPEELTSTLQDALYDCDWLNYDAFENDAALSGKELKLHKEKYRILIVPPVEVIPYASLAKAKAFFDKGGVVVGYGFLPTKSATLGKNSADILALSKAIWGDQPAPGSKACRTSAKGGRSYFLPENPSVADIAAAFGQDAGVLPTLQVVKGDTGNWLHILHRVKAGCDMFLVCNQNHTGAARPFTFRIDAPREPECWDALRNELTSLPFKRLGPKQVEVDLTLEPSESVMLVFQKKRRALPLRLEASAKPVRESVTIVRDATPPNLVIPSSPAVSNANKDEEALRGCEWVWGPEGNPASVAAPGLRYFRGLCTVAPGRKIKAARFIGTCDNSLTLFVNGKQVGKSSEATEGWRVPTTLDCTAQLKEGPNVLAIAALNLTDQPSPAGLIGRVEIRYEQGETQVVAIDATWKTSDKEQAGWNQPGFDDKAWVLAKNLGKYGCAPWHAFASGNQTRAATSPVTSDPFVGHGELPADLKLDQVRVFLEMDEIAPEEAARVTVNGHYAGGFIGKPFRLDVTRHVQSGTNTIVVEPFAPKNVRLTVHAK